ncbi:hypothetical protein CLIB1444_03S03290 [[Candida] jaroonii]|uniref:Uncharacterized protein n=1 Tax=[Candida] jaroonii TaxID=467808 RepID=A0ACA9Y6L5_9ASCO|nr:hypothetical protein CLIB1444_03S03290 [[Candida] jaroonii]
MVKRIDRILLDQLSEPIDSDDQLLIINNLNTENNDDFKTYFKLVNYFNLSVITILMISLIFIKSKLSINLCVINNLMIFDNFNKKYLKQTLGEKSPYLIIFFIIIQFFFSYFWIINITVYYLYYLIFDTFNHNTNDVDRLKNLTYKFKSV